MLVTARIEFVHLTGSDGRDRAPSDASPRVLATCRVAGLLRAFLAPGADGFAAADLGARQRTKLVGCQNSITPLTLEFAAACRSSRCEF